MRRPVLSPAYTMTVQEVLAALQGIREAEDDYAYLQSVQSDLTYVTEQQRSEVHSLITNALSDITPAPIQALANYSWTWRKPRIRARHLLSLQRLNHYPGSCVLTRKDSFKKLLTRCRRMPGKQSTQASVIPETFVLPAEAAQFIQATGLSMERVMLLQLASGTKGPYTTNSHGTWIVKPIGKSRGRGIELVTHPASVCLTDAVVVQRYIENPLLMQGYKFDLRLYTVVTSFQPLEAYISRLGFARFSSVPFSMQDGELKNKKMHLTNTSVQNGSCPPPFCEARNLCKWSLNRLWEHIEGISGCPWETVWLRVKESIVRCLAAADVGTARQGCCFELFGFDVLLDEHCAPWVLEVNASPSLEVETDLDESVKTQLMKDCYNLVSPQRFNRLALLEVCYRRLSSFHSKRNVSSSGTVRNRRILADDLHSILCSESCEVKGEGGGGGGGESQEKRDREKREGGEGGLGHFEILAPSPLSEKITKSMRV